MITDEETVNATLHLTQGDICVGDTILITERLFEKSAGKETQQGETSGGRRSSITQSITAKSVARLDASVASIGSAVQGNAASLQLGAFLGERTIAAHVTKVPSSQPSTRRA